MIDIKNNKNIPCVILCGGKGTRLADISEKLPKPMVKIGDIPIVVHIMKWYAKFGFTNFILCLGYKKEVFIDYFNNFLKYNNDIKIDLLNNNITILTDNYADWHITLCDTGLETKTGKRVKIVFDKYIDNQKFMLTYGDGLSDVNINQLYFSHINSNKLLTITQVKNPIRFGLIETDNNGNILQFKEKKQSDGYINGGFMVVDRKFIEKYLDNQDVFFEKEPIENAIHHADVHAFTHNGFWQCMDNAKEYELLNNLWKNNYAPWK